MDKNTTRLLIGIGVAFIAIVGLVGAGCLVLTYIYPTFAARSTQIGPEALHTLAAQTVSAQLTQTAAAATATSPSPSATPLPTELPTAQPTGTFTSIPPTPTSIPPTVTPTPLPCYWAGFVADVDLKDGTVFPPGAQFVKTWRLRNIGSCSWTSDFLLAFASGERMSGPQFTPIGEPIDPGQTVDVSVKLVAPSEAGKYRGNWQLRTPGGQTFGLGSDQKSVFWVEINVLETDDFAYDFALSYCTAKWSSAVGNLPCPGEVGDQDGFIILVDDPLIEINRQENETGLRTQPQHTNDGYIRGEYPAFKVKAGHHFKAVVACLSGAEKCDVIFQLSYRVGDGLPINLWEAREVHDGTITSVDVDLSSLVDLDVKFILTVQANGAPDGDQALWLLPRIEGGS